MTLIGAALCLALCSTALSSCSKSGDPPVTNQSGSSEPDAPNLVWNKNNQEQLLDAIAKAPANGLKPELFLKGDLPKDDAERSHLLTRAALTYAEALAHGYSDPKKIYKDYTIPRPSADLRPGLAQALASGAIGQWLASLPPQTDEYRELSKAHLAYLQMASKTSFQPVPQGTPMKPGSRDARTGAVATALNSIGYFSSTAPQRRYTGALVAAVKKLQSDFGIKADGVIGDATLDALNFGPGGRARQLAITMEQLRWLDRTPPATRIDVNTAAAFLDYWRDGTQVDHRNVVPGEPDKPTPQVQAYIFQLVANPKWRVPDSIAQKEMTTKSGQWLKENEFTIENGRYVQQSGDKNSLGLVKLDMDDPQQIYLHDTPFKELFALPERHRSHGCVRVENAIEFATMLAQQDDKLDKFQEAMSSGNETYVKLKTNIPVRLLYHTAYWNGSSVQFRPDVYGWDEDVGRALGLVQGPTRRQIELGQDIGP